KAYCWGTNGGAELGDGTLVNRPTPTPVAGATRFSAVDAGSTATCALGTDSLSYCWGSGGWFVQSGYAPTVTPGGVKLLALSFDGKYRACGIGVDSLAYCWGF